MKKKVITIIFFVNSPFVTLLAQGRLLLRSGFEPSVRITGEMKDLSGLDETTGFRWDDTTAWNP